LIDLQVRDSLHHHETEQVKRSLSAEKEFLQKQVQLANHEAASKAVEASEWRRNYHNL
jgi:hypothetical protein